MKAASDKEPKEKGRHYLFEREPDYSSATRLPGLPV